MKFSSAYANKKKQQFVPDGEMLTKQSHKDEVDVNKIIARYHQTGVLTYLNDLEAQYGDVVGMDFQTAQDMVVRAREMFDALPSAVRNRFQNNPALFLDFVDSPDNREELVRMGLATRREAEATTEAETARAKPAAEATPTEGGAE